MFLQDFKVVDASYETIVAALTTDSDSLFSDALGSGQEVGDHIAAKVAPKSWPAALGKTVEMYLGPLRHHGGGELLIAFSWEAPGRGSLFPRFDADLEVAPFGSSQTVLTIRGTYEPPAGRIGMLADELLLHHLAQSTVRAFLDALCSQLAGSISSGSR